MKQIKLLYLYPDMLELYGDYGNIQVLKYRCEKRGIEFKIDKYSIGDEMPNFEEYDIIFAGGGADNEQSILSEDLIKYKEQIKNFENKIKELMDIAESQEQEIFQLNQKENINLNKINTLNQLTEQLIFQLEERNRNNQYNNNQYNNHQYNGNPNNNNYNQNQSNNNFGNTSYMRKDSNNLYNNNRNNNNF